jgi:hypothetical protein
VHIVRNLRERLIIQIPRPLPKKKKRQIMRKKTEEANGKKTEMENIKNRWNGNSLPHNISPLSLLRSSNRKIPLPLRLSHLPPLPLYFLPTRITILPRPKHNLKLPPLPPPTE